MGELFERVTGSRAGWMDHSGRGAIRATGGDRLRFLNGMLSNEVEALGAEVAAAGAPGHRAGCARPHHSDPVGACHCVVVSVRPGHLRKY